MTKVLILKPGKDFTTNGFVIVHTWNPHDSRGKYHSRSTLAFPFQIPHSKQQLGTVLKTCQETNNSDTPCTVCK